MAQAVDAEIRDAATASWHARARWSAESAVAESFGRASGSDYRIGSTVWDRWSQPGGHAAARSGELDARRSATGGCAGCASGNHDDESHGLPTGLPHPLSDRGTDTARRSSDPVRISWDARGIPGSPPGPPCRSRLYPPDFRSNPRNIFCFDGEWPPYDCEAPCVDEQDCDPPAGADFLASVIQVDIDVVTNWTYPNGPGAEAELIGDGGCADHGAVERLLWAAHAFLLENMDLIEWAMCVALQWAPGWTDVGDATECVRNLLEGNLQEGRVLQFYLVCVLKNPGGDISPDGAAYGFGSPAPDGGVGPIIPVGKDFWQDRAAEYESGGVNGEPLCAVARAAQIVLHELLHMCIPQAGHPCEGSMNYCCWDNPGRTLSAFMWALGQRYPCLQGAPECADWTSDSSFMEFR
jgi:hypothetical protein